MSVDQRLRAIVDDFDLVNKAPLFRLAVLTGQVGQVSRSLYHAPDVNPDAKPLPDGEDDPLSDLAIQTALFITARGRSFEEMLARGEARLKERVYSKTRMVDSGQSVMAVPGVGSGTLIVIRDERDIPRIAAIAAVHRPCIVALKDAYMWEKAAATILAAGPEYVVGLVLRDAGLTSHPVTVAREHCIPTLTRLSDAEWAEVERLEGIGEKVQLGPNPVVWRFVP
jgi:hypothetical protein